jgi:hypothetical protein
MRNTSTSLLYSPLLVGAVLCSTISDLPIRTSGVEGAHPNLESRASSRLDQLFEPIPLTRVEPGTRINDRSYPGRNWVLISRPQVTSGDLHRVSRQTLQLAQLCFRAVNVQVESDSATPGRYRLGRVAVGLGTSAGGDLIVSKSTAAGLGVPLGMFESLALAENEKQVHNIVQVARSATMAVVDYPSVLLRGGRHAPVVFRQAYLVDPRDGGVYSLLWILDPVGDAYRRADSSLMLLEPNQIFACDLHVDTTQFFLGTPTPEAFAIVRTPAGTRLRESSNFASLADLRQFTPNTAYQLELSLWDALFPASR